MEKTVAQRLASLEGLQKIDSQLDEIKKVRGALPDEVADLEDEIAGYQTRVDKFKGEVSNLEANICVLYTSPSPRDRRQSRMPPSA